MTKAMHMPAVKGVVDKECDIFRKNCCPGTYQKCRDKADVIRKASSLRNFDGPLLVCSLQSTKGHCVAVSQNIKPLCNNWCGRKSCPLSERGVTAVLLQPCPRKGRGATQGNVLAVYATCLIPQPTVKTDCQKTIRCSFSLCGLEESHKPISQIDKHRLHQLGAAMPSGTGDMHVTRIRNHHSSKRILLSMRAGYVVSRPLRHRRLQTEDDDAEGQPRSWCQNTKTHSKRWNAKKQRTMTISGSKRVSTFTVIMLRLAVGSMFLTSHHSL